MLTNPNYLNNFILLYLSRLNTPALNQLINKSKEQGIKMNNSDNSRFFVSLSDGTTNLEVKQEEFQEIKLAMEKNEKFYELIQESKGITTKININLSNVISLNEKVSHKETVAAKLTDDEREKVFAEALSTDEGISVLLDSMVVPIETSITYQSIGRKILIPDHVPENHVLQYDKAPNTPVVVVDKSKKIKVVNSKSTELKLKYVTINAKTSVELESNHFNRIDRAQVNLRNSLAEQENNLIFQMLEKAAEVSGNIIESKYSKLMTPQHALDTGEESDINNAFAKIEKTRLSVAHILVSSATFAVIRSWGKDYLDFVTQREVLMTGVFARLWTSDIILGKIPDNYVYVLAPPEFLGPIALESKKIQIKKGSKTEEKMEIKATEEIGLCITNVNGVCLIKLKTK